MANTPLTIEEEVKERVAYKSPYEHWKESEGLPTYRGLFIKNLYDLELTPWRSSGEGLAAFINLDGTGGDDLVFNNGNMSAPGACNPNTSVQNASTSGTAPVGATRLTWSMRTTVRSPSRP